MCFLHQDFQLNRVAIEEGAGAEPSPAGARPKKKNRKTYDLTAADKFWQKHKGRWVEQSCWCCSPPDVGPREQMWFLTTVCSAQSLS